MFRAYSRRVDRRIFTRINQWLARRGDKTNSASLYRFIESAGLKTLQEFYGIPQSTLVQIGKISCYPYNYNLRFVSPSPSPYPENNRAYGDFFPNYSPSAPAVIMLSGWLDSNSDYTRLAHWVRLCGRNLWTLDMPYHGRRTPQGARSGELAITADLVRTLQGVGQAAADARVLVNALWELGARDIAVMGFSLGGWVGALLCLVESRVSRAILVTPVVRPDKLFDYSPYFTSIREAVEENDREIVFNSLRHLFIPEGIKPAIDPDRISLIGSIDDPLAAPRDVKELAASWNCRHEIIPGGHVTVYFTARMWRRLFCLLSR